MMKIQAVIKRYFGRAASVGALAGAMLAVGLPACNSSGGADYDLSLEPDFSSVAVKSFSLQADKSVLHNLDSVYFSIDLRSFRVFNADSLPVGTRVDSLAVTMTTDQVSVAKFIVPTEEGTDTVDFLTSPNDHLDFSRGPLTLHVESLDGKNIRDYEVKVNVHLMAPDSLFWAETAERPLPTDIEADCQRTVVFKGRAYCLTAGTGRYCMAVADNPSGEWTLSVPSFPSGVKVGSLQATDDALYVLASDGTLLSSSDGQAWSSTGQTWTATTAAYGPTLLGLKADGAATAYASYPEAIVAGRAPDDFPVSGNSHGIVLETKWAQNNQILTCAGRDVAGRLQGSTWAFDGTKWAKIGGGLPAAEGYAVTQYKVCSTDTVTWRVKETTMMLALGGRNAEGCQRDVYISKDLGMNWRKADAMLQLPDYIPSLAFADAWVFDSTLRVSRSLADDWRIISRSRATAPITEWQCPYIYLFGGVTADGRLQPKVWRGVINHLSFKPLQ